jgi:hypothetical protein
MKDLCSYHEHVHPAAELFGAAPDGDMPSGEPQRRYRQQGPSSTVWNSCDEGPLCLRTDGVYAVRTGEASQ